MTNEENFLRCISIVAISKRILLYCKLKLNLGLKVNFVKNTVRLCCTRTITYAKNCDFVRDWQSNSWKTNYLGFFIDPLYQRIATFVFCKLVTISKIEVHINNSKVTYILIALESNIPLTHAQSFLFLSKLQSCTHAYIYVQADRNAVYANTFRIRGA